jgi:hypothetical protein
MAVVESICGPVWEADDSERPSAPKPPIAPAPSSESPSNGESIFEKFNN